MMALFLFVLLLWAPLLGMGTIITAPAAAVAETSFVAPTGDHASSAALALARVVVTSSQGSRASASDFSAAAAATTTTTTQTLQGSEASPTAETGGPAYEPPSEKCTKSKLKKYKNVDVWVARSVTIFLTLVTLWEGRSSWLAVKASLLTFNTFVGVVSIFLRLFVWRCATHQRTEAEHDAFVNSILSTACSFLVALWKWGLKAQSVYGERFAAWLHDKSWFQKATAAWTIAKCWWYIDASTTRTRSRSSAVVSTVVLPEYSGVRRRRNAMSSETESHVRKVEEAG